MCKIAVGVFTHNHYEIVEYVLSTSLNFYFESEIDIYYYDSSEDNKTEQVIRKYQERGYNNLFYVKVPSEYGPAEKTLIFFEGKDLKKNYDYIWPVKDRSFCPPVVLKKIVSEARKKRDVILVVMHQDWMSENQEYNNALDFYKVWGWMSTSLDTVIYNRETMLPNFHERKHNEIYKQEYSKPWCAYITLFHRLAELDAVNISVLCDSEMMIYNAPQGKSTWEKEVFKFWKDLWIEANESLPECYNEYKNSTIKIATSLPWILGGIPRLLDLHHKGILTEENYDDIIQNWERVSDIPREIVKEIAYGVYDIYHDVLTMEASQSETVNLLIQLTKLLKAEKMGKEQIPFDNIIKCVQGEIISKNKYSTQVVNNIIGSVHDIVAYARQKDTDVDEVIKSIQILINFILLSK